MKNQNKEPKLFLQQKRQQQPMEKQLNYLQLTVSLGRRSIVMAEHFWSLQYCRDLVTNLCSATKFVSQLTNLDCCDLIVILPPLFVMTSLFY